MLSFRRNTSRIFTTLVALSAAFSTACSDTPTAPAQAVVPELPNAVASANVITDAAAVLNMTMQPGKIGFGQSALFTFAVSKNGRPVAKTKIEVWFSGAHGLQSTHWTLTTNSAGQVSKTLTLPRGEWMYSSFVDMNMSVESVGGYKIWKIKK